MQMPTAPLPKGAVKPKIFPEEEIEEEAKRLFEAIGQSSRSVSYTHLTLPTKRIV